MVVLPRPARVAARLAQCVLSIGDGLLIRLHLLLLVGDGRLRLAVLLAQRMAARLILGRLLRIAPVVLHHLLARFALQHAQLALVLLQFLAQRGEFRAPLRRRHLLPARRGTGSLLGFGLWRRGRCPDGRDAALGRQIIVVENLGGLRSVLALLPRFARCGGQGVLLARGSIRLRRRRRLWALGSGWPLRAILSGQSRG